MHKKALTIGYKKKTESEKEIEREQTTNFNLYYRTELKMLSRQMKR